LGRNPMEVVNKILKAVGSRQKEVLKDAWL